VNGQTKIVDEKVIKKKTQNVIHTGDNVGERAIGGARKGGTVTEKGGQAYGVAQAKTQTLQGEQFFT